MTRPLLLVFSGLLATVLLLAACTKSSDYGRFISVPTDGWSDAAPLVFDTDTLPPGAYDLQLIVRTSADHSYPFGELALLVRHESTTKADSTGHAITARSDSLISFALYDNDGSPEGRGLSLREHETEAGCVWLSDTAAVRITVNHHMHGGIISGISAVGMSLKKRQS